MGEEKGVEREGGKAGPNHKALSPTPTPHPGPGCGVSTVFHDASNLIFQVVANTPQPPLGDPIYCVHESALTGPPEGSPRGELQVKTEVENVELDEM